MTFKTQQLVEILSEEELLKLKLKPTKIDEIFSIDLTLTTLCQIDGEDFINFCGRLRKHELYLSTMIYIFHEKYSYYNAIEISWKHKLLFRTSLLHYEMVSKRWVTKVKGCLPSSRSQTTLTRLWLFLTTYPLRWHFLLYEHWLKKSEHFKTTYLVL